MPAPNLLLIFVLHLIPSPLEAAEATTIEVGVTGAQVGATRFESPTTALVGWTRSTVDQNYCGLSRLDLADRDSRRRDHHGRLFTDVGEGSLCCTPASSLLPPRKNRGLAVTTCSHRGGFWIWSQAVTTASLTTGVPVPVHPRPGILQGHPKLLPAAGQEHWLIWFESAPGDRGGVVRATRLDDEGEPLMTPFTVSDTRAASALSHSATSPPAAALLPDGGLAIAWAAIRGRERQGIYLRLFGHDGEPRTAELEATPDGHERARSPRLFVDSSGTLHLVWHNRAVGGEGTRAYFRRFSFAGAPLGAELPLATDLPGRDQLHARIAASGEHRVLAWYERPERSSAIGWLALRRWDPERGPLGLTTRVPIDGLGSWPFLELVAGPDGSEDELRLVWQPAGEDPWDRSPTLVSWLEVKPPESR